MIDSCNAHIIAWEEYQLREQSLARRERFDYEYSIGSIDIRRTDRRSRLPKRVGQLLRSLGTTLMTAV